MDDQALFFEDLNDALREAVRVCGGMKVVGAQLWPEKTPEAAGRLLSDCLNPHRAERLTPDHLLLVLRLARGRGFHRAMAFIAESIGYQAQPIEPEDERAQLQRLFSESVRQQGEILRRMEKLSALGGTATLTRAA